jgi:hypothetical protein
MKKSIIVAVVLVAATLGIRWLLRDRQQLGEFCCGRFPARKDETTTGAEAVAQVA